jgi:Domain of unknown function (DUF6438)
MAIVRVILVVILTFAPFSFSYAQEPIPKDLLITLERTGCYGPCPFYKVTIDSSGSVTFTAQFDDLKKGLVTKEPMKGSVTVSELRQLIAAFKEINFFSLRRQYGYSDKYDPTPGCPQVATDNPTVITSLMLGGRFKEVRHYHGCRGAEILGKLRNLESLIDEIAKTAQFRSKFKWADWGAPVDTDQK